MPSLGCTAYSWADCVEFLLRPVHRLNPRSAYDCVSRVSPTSASLLVPDDLGCFASDRSKLVPRTLNQRIIVERLPAYVPELNPVEYIWVYLKQHELANVCPKDLWPLRSAARRAL